MFALWSLLALALVILYYFFIIKGKINNNFPLYGQEGASTIDEFYKIRTQNVLWAELYKNKNNLDSLVIVRPLNWYVYQTGAIFYYMTYVVNNKPCLPSQISCIKLVASQQPTTDETVDKLVTTCLNIPQYSILKIFTTCTQHIETSVVSLDVLLETASKEEPLTLIKILNYLIEKCHLNLRNLQD